MECKACGAWFVSTMKTDLCTTCERAMKRLGFGNFSYDRLRELAQADWEGRVHILPSPRENTCGKCGNFTRTPGCGYGECTLRPGLRPYQSRAKCKRYTEKALEEMEVNPDG